MSAADRPARDVGKLARGSLLSRLIGLAQAAAPAHRRSPRPCRRQPRAAATPCSPAASNLAVNACPSPDLDFAAVGAAGPLAENLQGFSWLRDLAAAAGREKGARLAEALAGRWLIAHGTRADAAWAPELWGERILYWTAYAPYVLSSRDAGYRSALLNTLGSRRAPS